MAIWNTLDFFKLQIFHIGKLTSINGWFSDVTYKCHTVTWEGTSESIPPQCPWNFKKSIPNLQPYLKPEMYIFLHNTHQPIGVLGGGSFKYIFLMFIRNLGFHDPIWRGIFFRWVGSTSIHSLSFPGVNKVPCIQGLFDVMKPTFHQAPRKIQGH